MRYRLFFSPHSDDFRFYTYGSSEPILTELFNFVDREAKNITDINLCLYLYDNWVLHSKMKSLAELGISIRVISIPLEGYDDKNPKNIINPDTKEVVYKDVTKYDLAKFVYDDIINYNNTNYSLYVFGHTFVRSRRIKHFARGTLPYSLHTKSIFIKMRDGRSFTGLTSSNLAVRDVSKDELLLFIEDTPNTRKSSELFFNELIANSTPVKQWHNPNPHFIYNMNCIDAGQPNCNNYTAPFFTDSPIRISKQLSNIIKNAEKRIYICAEHLAAYNYADIEGELQPGLFNDVFEKCQEGIPVYCLSQTYVDANGDPHGQRVPENKVNYKKLIKKVDELQECKHECTYAVNKNVHAKFIVVDNMVIISTGNFTPTEFMYGPVKIDDFEAEVLKDVTYDGIHSEVSHFIILKDRSAAEQCISFFERIVNYKDTYIHQRTKTIPTVSNVENQRYYINCPYSQKDEAKALGAKWDPNMRKWYYTSPDQEKLFRRWLE